MTAPVVFRPRECWTADGREKFRFINRREAKAAARNLSGGPRPYRCRYCDAWHVGRQADARAS